MLELGPNRYVKEVGRTNRSVNEQGKPVFCVVLGLFDENENQVVFLQEDGSETPIVWLSLPIEIKVQQFVLPGIDKDKILQ